MLYDVLAMQSTSYFTFFKKLKVVVFICRFLYLIETVLPVHFPPYFLCNPRQVILPLSVLVGTYLPMRVSVSPINTVNSCQTCSVDSDVLAVYLAHQDLPVGFLLLRYLVLLTVEALSLLYLLVIS